MLLLAAVIVAATATMGEVAQAQQNITLTASGKVVDNAAMGVPGATVYLGLRQANGRFNWTVANPALTDANGNYMGTTRMVDIGNGVAMGANVPYRLFGKKSTATYLGQQVDGLSRTYNIYNVNGLRGANAGNVMNPGNGNDVAVNGVDITVQPFNQNFSFLAVQGGQPQERNLAFWDPTYTFTSTNPGMQQGFITFSDVPFGDDDAIPIAGVHLYGNGTAAITNAQDTGGNPLSESLFGNLLQISQLQVLGVDAQGNAMLGSGSVAVVDHTGATLFSATISNLMADTTTGGLLFSGELINPSFPDAGNSQLLANWQSDVNGGNSFTIAFDRELISASNGFTTSATLTSFVGLATVPEPSAGLLLAMGLLAIGVRWRPGRQR